jgi:Tol biopolymer transport system component/predicted Ser/Thr protein kinase
MIGETIAHYRITAKIGEGGMGEVYRATDTRLGREVAIKIVKEQFTERFEREARAIAALNHPHICHLYDVGPNYLVMELIDGTPLKGPLPLDKAIEYAGQILDALDAAHKKGITHRDLKPANILLTKQGIKLLDFGLAKQTAPLKETDVTRALTGQGQILGTLQYMSPEQLQGKEVDSRSDLFSFGCVLYEILTGKRAFDGDSTASVIAAILQRPAPSIAAVAPAALDRALQRCLAKDPDDRWQSARDLKSELEWIAGDGATTGGAPVQKPWRKRAAWITTAAVLGGAMFFAARPSKTPSVNGLVRLTVNPPEKTTYSAAMVGPIQVPQFALSPDGRAIVFAASKPGTKAMLWLRPMEEVAAHPLPGTENAEYPFWSPDSRWVGFFAQGKLKKIPSVGGIVQQIAEGFPDSRGGSWGPDDTILCSTGAGSIYFVRSTGGAVTPVTKLDGSRQEGSHRFPQFLPDGRHFLFTVRSGLAEQRGIYAGSLDGKTKKRLVGFDSSAVYAPPGYLLFLKGDTLLGQVFDPQHLELSGQPFTVAEQVGHAGSAYGAFSASGTGTLAHAGAMTHIGRLIWFDRDGKQLGSVGPDGDYATFRLSPDGKRLAALLVDPKEASADIWLTDLSRGSPSRFTFGPGLTVTPIWSPDGERVVFATSRKGLNEFYQKSAGGGGSEEAVLLEEAERAAHLESFTIVPSDWSPDGRNLIFSTFAASGYDLWLLPLTGDRKPTRLLGSPSDEMHANFSPDGRLVSYSSNESGRFEVFVQTFPLSDRKWQVSTNGGYEPRWRRDGLEIYYLSEDRKLMAVAVGAGPSFDVPKPLFQTRVAEDVTEQRTHFVPSRDGRRFLINTQSGDPAPTPITIVLNWTAGLKK